MDLSLLGNTDDIQTINYQGNTIELDTYRNAKYRNEDSWIIRSINRLKGMWKYALAIGFLLLAIFLFNSEVMAKCSTFIVPRISELKDALNDKYKFKSKNLRIMAERIYDYRVAKEYIPQGQQDEYISIFLPSTTQEPLPSSSSLQDVALYKLATCDTKEKFNVLVSYIPIFNHPRYSECLKDYNKDNKKFNHSDTRDIIFNEVLNIENYLETANLSNYAAFIKNNATDQWLFELLDQGFKGFMNP